LDFSILKSLPAFPANRLAQRLRFCLTLTQTVLPTEVLVTRPRLLVAAQIAAQLLTAPVPIPLIRFSLQSSIFLLPLALDILDSLPSLYGVPLAPLFDALL
jgi:hypothetical protein